MDYRRVVNFRLNGNEYAMFLDDFNKHYFLKVNNNSFNYITFDELIDISLHYALTPNVMNIENDNPKKKKIKMIPKIILGGTSLILVGTTLFSSYLDRRVRERYLENQKNRPTTPEVIMTVDDYISKYQTIKLGTKEYKIDTYAESDLVKYTYVYDMDYLYKAIDCKEISIEEMKRVVDTNPNINSTFKLLICDFIDKIYSKYPDVNKNVLYENLKSLKVNVVDNRDMMFKTLSTTASGCYVKKENAIYVLKDAKFDPQTWDYQVIIHELCHCMRLMEWIGKDGTRYIISFEGEYKNTPVSEALNSLFAVSLLGYEEKDIAYQFQSNMLKVVLDCMDNYTLADYINHSLSYFASKLDEFNHDDNYATVILDLIRIQYDDYHSDKVDIKQEEYYRIYDYISKMYYDKNMTEDMSYDEAKKLTDKLLEEILYDVPEEYNVDTNHFYDYLNEYCQEKGIEINNTFSK